MGNNILLDCDNRHPTSVLTILREMSMIGILYPKALKQIIINYQNLNLDASGFNIFEGEKFVKVMAAICPNYLRKIAVNINNISFDYREFLGILKIFVEKKIDYATTINNISQLQNILNEYFFHGFILCDCNYLAEDVVKRMDNFMKYENWAIVGRYEETDQNNFIIEDYELSKGKNSIYRLQCYISKNDRMRNGEFSKEYTFITTKSFLNAPLRFPSFLDLQSFSDSESVKSYQMRFKI